MRWRTCIAAQIGLVLALAGCAPREAATAEPKPAAAPARQLDDAALRAQGLRIEPLPGGARLVCDAASGRCFCHEALECGADGKGCPDMAANLAAFRAALARGPGQRTVDCRRAEVGTCGAFRYFLFNGDIERREMRWFDAEGRLVAMRNRTDHPAYCGGRSMTRVLGTLPDCTPTARTELVCGEAGPQGFSALDDALGRAPARR